MTLFLILTQIAKFSFALILVNLIAKIGVWNHVMYSYLVFTWFHFAGYKYSWSVAVVHHHLNIVPISSYTDDFLELVSLAMKGVCLGFTCSQCRPKLCHWLPYFMKQYLEILMYFFSIFRKSVIIIIYAHKAFPLLYFYKI
jgi:hypothetical protein